MEVSDESATTKYVEPASGQEGAMDAVSAEATQVGKDGKDEVAIEVEADKPAAEQKIAELEAKNKDTHDRMLRAMADLENYKRRVKKDLEDVRTESQGKVLKEMLPVVDNLERAVAHAGQVPDMQGVIDGVRLVLRQFAQAFERCGVTIISAKGSQFDPNLHEAVSQIETDDHPPGTVVEVLQTGYKIGERLLRPTLAVVSKAKSKPADSSAADANGSPEADKAAQE